MSADLPVEEPARRVNPAPPGGTREIDAWDRSFRPWDVYFGVVWSATLVFTVAAPNSTPVRATAFTLFFLLAPWYVWFGRRELMRGLDSRGALVYIYVAILLFIPPVVLVGEMRSAAFALVPQCFMLLSMSRALWAVVVLNAVPVIGWALWWRPDGEAIFFNALFAVVSLAFSAVLGSWIIRIIAQSAERAELIAELEASREEVSRLSAERGALAERERMSREIHDTLAQGFTSLLMLVQAVESELERDLPGARRHLDLMADTARRNLAEARALVAGGAPADLNGNSLPDALRRLAARHGPGPAEVSVDVTVEVTGLVRPLAPALEVVALRTCQEALSNTVRHAGSGARAAISLAYSDAELCVRIRDTGRGFDVSAPSDGYGLSGLRARAAEVGGSAEVRSEPGDGTLVAVHLPLPPPPSLTGSPT
ncbi:sensor histidine kinase [Streptomyces sp. NPDC006645]|uniref:sensor histidine kinase n=1 Tax=unclassified Streptomyces TaxID=2593676 RepID=UPI0033BDF29A